MDLILRMELRIQSISVGSLAKDKTGTDAKLGAQSDLDQCECQVFDLILRVWPQQNLVHFDTGEIFLSKSSQVKQAWKRPVVEHCNLS